MIQKFKITFYSLIVLLVLVLPSQAIAQNATSCKGWNCSIEGQICPQGVPGARAGDFICTNSKWVAVKTFSTHFSRAECIERLKKRMNWVWGERQAAEFC